MLFLSSLCELICTLFFQTCSHGVFHPLLLYFTFMLLFCGIGTNGLEELSALDEGFEEYEPSLFNESALSFERSIQTQEVNKQLDRNIDSFLLRLTPYLQLTSAHKVLEWLIQRYGKGNGDTIILLFAVISIVL